MNIKSVLTCRFNQKIYERLWVTDTSDNCRIVPEYRLSSITEERLIPVRLIEMSSKPGYRDILAVYPDAVTNEPNDGFGLKERYENDSFGPAQFHDINYRRAKWRSRLNYRLRPTDCEAIKGLDERQKPYGSCQIKVTEIIPNGDKEILRGTIEWHAKQLDNPHLLCLDEKLHLLVEHYEILGKRSAVNPIDNHVHDCTIEFSLQIERRDSNLYLVAWSGTDPHDLTYYRIGPEEQTRLRQPYSFYLLQDAGVDPSYANWIDRTRSTPYQLDLQRSVSAAQSKPYFRLYLTVHKESSIRLASETVSSILHQTFPGWELFIVCQECSPHIDVSDERVTVIVGSTSKDDVLLPTSSHLGNSVKYVAYLQPGTLLEPDTLYQAEIATQQHHPDVLYFDEDSYSIPNVYFHPIFKPDFNLELLRCQNYLGSVAFFRMPPSIPNWTKELPSQDEQLYSLALHIAGHGGTFTHIARPSIHCHQPNHNRRYPELLSYDHVVDAHLKQMCIDATVDSYKGHTRVTYTTPSENPLVSIIIPNKDQVSLLKNCISSIIEKTVYGNYEIIVVENNSSSQETFDYYRQITSSSNGRIAVIEQQGEFNFSNLINCGRSRAHGRYLLLLNNDTEVITPHWLDIMVGLCSQKRIGIVGVKLLYPDNTIQHAGVCAVKTTAHQFRNLPNSQHSYLSLADSQREVSAVTAACLMCRSSVFDEAGGFNPDLAVAYNDMDFCFSVRDLGYSVVYTPYVELYHFESVSRGRDDNPEDSRRAIRSVKEWSKFLIKWGDPVYAYDPYFSPNLRDGFPDCCYYLLKE